MWLVRARLGSCCLADQGGRGRLVKRPGWCSRLLRVGGRRALLAWTWLLDGRWARARSQPCCLADQGGVGGWLSVRRMTFTFGASRRPYCSPGLDMAPGWAVGPGEAVTTREVAHLSQTTPTCPPRGNDGDKLMEPNPPTDVHTHNAGTVPLHRPTAALSARPAMLLPGHRSLGRAPATERRSTERMSTPGPSPPLIPCLERFPKW